MYENDKGFLQKIASVIEVNPQDVINDAQNFGIEVQKIEDFRSDKIDYKKIEILMAGYAKIAVDYSAYAGLTSGIGGFLSAIPLVIADLINMAAQLFRLNNRLCILNGFNPKDALHFENAMLIYAKAFGFESATRAVLKEMIKEAIEEGGKRGPAKTVIIKIIMWVAKNIFKREIAKRTAGKIVPIIGAIIGYKINQFYADNVSKKMINDFRKLHNDLK